MIIIFFSYWWLSETNFSLSLDQGRATLSARHTHDVLQARANVKNNKYSEVHRPVHKAFASAIVGMSGQMPM